MDAVTLTIWVSTAIAAFLVGVAKNGVPGLGILVVPLVAYAFPAKESVGVLLPMLIVGDVIAIRMYRRHAQWNKLAGLLPYVIAGMILAGFVLARIDNQALRPLLGVLVLSLLILEMARTHFQWTHLPQHPAFVGSIGASAGFATTVGNAAGPIMSLYLLARGLPKQQFVGTAAWFFFLVNSSKVPLFVHLDMITSHTLLINAIMIPFIVAGAWLGVKLLPRIPQRLFNALVRLLTGAAAIGLLV